MHPRTVHIGLLSVGILILIWSAINPQDQFTWLLEVIPVLLIVPILIITYTRFKWSTLTYCAIFIHATILMVGGHYTYAEVPLFNWIRDAFNLSRNHYDRIGHFAQGFIPAIVAHELLVRKKVFADKRWLPLVVVCICMAISASYELIEWGVAEATGSAADAFLGTQGDVWDTQWDMFLALLGAVSASIITRNRSYSEQPNTQLNKST